MTTPLRNNPPPHQMRILIGLTMLASLGVLLINLLVLRPKIQRLILERDQYARQLATERSARKLAEALCHQTKAELAQAIQRLQALQMQLTQTSNELARSRSEVAALHKALDQSTRQTRRAEQELARWTALEVTIEDILNSQRRLAEVASARDFLAAHNTALEAELEDYKAKYGPFAPPPMDLRANVLAVNPKWSFVMLDLGTAQRAKPTWQLLVSRQDQLVAKVEIVNVDGDHSFANILPGWNLGAIRPGDLVLPAAHQSAANHRTYP